MRKIRSGDTVLVTAGRNKGQQGKVRINVIERDRVVIEGVNIVKKHIKRGRARQAGIVEVEAPLHVSNVLLICPSCNQATRVGVRTGDDGKNKKCCSGICKGKRPKKGKRDTSECKAHGAGGCQEGQDLCLGDDIPCGPPGAYCYRTTGKASFCAELGFCMDCKKDTDCEPSHGPGAACVVCASCGGDVNTSCFSASV